MSGVGAAAVAESCCGCRAQQLQLCPALAVAGTQLPLLLSGVQSDVAAAADGAGRIASKAEQQQQQPQPSEFISERYTSLARQDDLWHQLGPHLKLDAGALFLFKYRAI